MKYYVTMTDTYLSGWGEAKGKTNKMVVECDTLQQAEQIVQAARRRPEMQRVNLCLSRPRYGSHVSQSWKTWDDLGAIWKGAMV